MNKFKIGEELQVYNLPENCTDYEYNGSVVIVVALPGYYNKFPKAYGARFKDGTVMPCVETYLRVPPYGTPSGRAQRNEVVSWEQFDARTGIDSSTFRNMGAV